MGGIRAHLLVFVRKRLSAMTKQRKIKAGVIGYGGGFEMGRFHLKLMSDTNRAVPVAVCDVSEERLAVAREAFPPPASDRPRHDE